MADIKPRLAASFSQPQRHSHSHTASRKSAGTALLKRARGASPRNGHGKAPVLTLSPGRSSSTLSQSTVTVRVALRHPPTPTPSHAGKRVKVGRLHHCRLDDDTGEYTHHPSRNRDHLLRPRGGQLTCAARFRLNVLRQGEDGGSILSLNPIFISSQATLLSPL